MRQINENSALAAIKRTATRMVGISAKKPDMLKNVRKILNNQSLLIDSDLRATLDCLNDQEKSFFMINQDIILAKNSKNSLIWAFLLDETIDRKLTNKVMNIQSKERKETMNKTETMMNELNSLISAANQLTNAATELLNMINAEPAKTEEPVKKPVVTSMTIPPTKEKPKKATVSFDIDKFKSSAYAGPIPATMINRMASIDSSGDMMNDFDKFNQLAREVWGYVKANETSEKGKALYICAPKSLPALVDYLWSIRLDVDFAKMTSKPLAAPATVNKKEPAKTAAPAKKKYYTNNTHTLTGIAKNLGIDMAFLQDLAATIRDIKEGGEIDDDDKLLIKSELLDNATIDLPKIKMASLVRKSVDWLCSL